MRHRKRGRRFTKSIGQQRALLRGLASSLILKEKITTTEARAKELRSFIEKSITRSKRDTIANRKFLAKDFSAQVIKKTFKELGPRYNLRAGGYTRITKISPRKSDGARMAVIELIK